MTDFARLMNDYFVKYLAGQKGSGSNTMKTYRDTFVQLLEFMNEKKHIRADCIEVDSFSYDIINEFLEYLEKEKRVSIRDISLDYSTEEKEELLEWLKNSI